MCGRDWGAEGAREERREEWGTGWGEERGRGRRRTSGGRRANKWWANERRANEQWANERMGCDRKRCVEGMRLVQAGTRARRSVGGSIRWRYRSGGWRGCNDSARTAASKDCAAVEGSRRPPSRFPVDDARLISESRVPGREDEANATGRMRWQQQPGDARRPWAEPPARAPGVCRRRRGVPGRVRGAQKKRRRRPKRRAAVSSSVEAGVWRPPLQRRATEAGGYAGAEGRVRTTSTAHATASSVSAAMHFISRLCLLLSFFLLFFRIGCDKLGFTRIG